MVSSLKAAVALQTAKLFKDGFVIIDLETTGFDRDPTVEVVEVAILNQKGETLLNTQVDQLIAAMASFTSQTGLSWDQGIDQQPQEVQTVLAANGWQ